MSRQIVLTTSEGVELQYTLAGLGSRFLALLLDTLIQSLIVIAVLIAIGISAWATLWFWGGAGWWWIAMVVLALFAVVDGYFLLFETMWNGQTPGKRMVGLRVLRDDGFPLDFRGALIRNVMRIIDFLPVSYGVGAACIMFSKQHRRLGDMVAGTIVVREADDGAKNAIETGFTWQVASVQVTADHGVPLPLELLTSAHLELVETFLRRRGQLSQDVRSRMARDVANRMRAQMRLDPRAEPLDPERLLEDIVRGTARRAGL